jgi:hypothetical protein
MVTSGNAGPGTSRFCGTTARSVSVEVTVPSARVRRRFSSWLERRSPWQFALTWAACLFLTTLAAGGAAQWLIKRHLDLTFLFTYAGLFAVGVSAAATLSRRHQLRQQQSAKGPPPSRWWPWKQ